MGLMRPMELLLCRSHSEELGRSERVSAGGKREREREREREGGRGGERERTLLQRTHLDV